MRIESCALSLALAFLAISSIQAEMFGKYGRSHDPYQDPFFNLDSSRRIPTGPGTNAGYNTTGPSYNSTASHGAFLGGCAHGSCSAGGRGASSYGNCPLPTSAELKLWVPDCYCVEINGQRTKHQSLGGIHKGSRIYRLEALDLERVSPCDIIVSRFDPMTGQTIRLHYAFPAQAGQKYQVHFPGQFRPLTDVPTERLVSLPQSTQESHDQVAEEVVPVEDVVGGDLFGSVELPPVPAPIGSPDIQIEHPTDRPTRSSADMLVGADMLVDTVKLNQVPATNSLIRFWISNDVRVFIDSEEVYTNPSANLPGSRICSLGGFLPNESRAVLIRFEVNENILHEELYRVGGGALSNIALVFDR